MIAAYYGQELLSTFEDSIGEIALSPTSGGMFTIHVEHNASKSSAGVTDADHVKETLIWDRKVGQPLHIYQIQTPDIPEIEIADSHIQRLRPSKASQRRRFVGKSLRSCLYNLPLTISM